MPSAYSAPDDERPKAKAAKAKQTNCYQVSRSKTHTVDLERKPEIYIVDSSPSLGGASFMRQCEIPMESKHQCPDSPQWQRTYLLSAATVLPFRRSELQFHGTGRSVGQQHSRSHQRWPLETLIFESDLLHKPTRNTSFYLCAIAGKALPASGFQSIWLCLNQRPIRSSTSTRRVAYRSRLLLMSLLGWLVFISMARMRRALKVGWGSLCSCILAKA